MSNAIQHATVCVSNFEWGVVPEDQPEAEAQLIAMGIPVMDGVCSALDVLSYLHRITQRNRDLLDCATLVVDAHQQKLPESAMSMAIEGVEAHRDLARASDRDIRRRLLQPASTQAPVSALKNTAMVIAFKPRQ